MPPASLRYDDVVAVFEVFTPICEHVAGVCELLQAIIPEHNEADI